MFLLCYATKLFTKLIRISTNQVNRALYTTQEKTVLHRLSNIMVISEPIELYVTFSFCARLVIRH